MYVITDNNDIVIKMSDTIGYQENGNVLVDNGSLAIAKILVKGVFEVSDIPKEVSEYKYCYTEEKGFYKNQDYVEYVSPEQEILNLKGELADTQIAITEIYEMLEAQNG